MRNRFPYILMLCLAVLLLSVVGCNKRPKGVLSEKDMISLIVDLELAETYVSLYNEDGYEEQFRSAALEGVLKKHHLSKADFDSTMTWYGHNIDVYSEVLNKADEELTKRQMKVSGGVIEEATLEDLWPYSKHYMINPQSASDNLAFSISPEEISKGDKFEWKGRLSSMADGSVMIGVEYDNGKSSYAYKQLMGINKIDMGLQTDTAYRVKRIFGNLHINRLPNSRSIVWVDSLALAKFPFDSTEYHKIYSQRSFYAPKRKIKLPKDSLVKEKGLPTDLADPAMEDD